VTRGAAGGLPLAILAWACAAAPPPAQEEVSMADTGPAALKAALSSPDPAARARAATEWADPAGAGVLVAHLEAGEADPGVLCAALNTLAGLKAPGLAGPAVPLLSHADAGVRRCAVVALGEVKAAAALLPVRALLADPDGFVREGAAWAVGRIEGPAPAATGPPPADLEALLLAAAGADEDAAVDALVALSDLDHPAVPPALRALRDRVPPERREMVERALAAQKDQFGRE
jgi:HEAT repeat protein